MDEKNEIRPAPLRSSVSVEAVKIDDAENAFEVFQKQEGKVDFRTVGWVHASVIFLKVIFATGVLSIPSAMYVLGAFPGAVNVLAWQALNTYSAIVQGNFRNAHAHCHSIADMAEVLGGAVLREIVGVLFLAAYAICAGSGIIGASTALNALSSHAICTNYFSLVSAFVIFALASVRKFEKIAWLTWAGFLSVYIGVFIVVVGVTTRSRPAAAPQTGDFDLGYHVIGTPTFVSGITAAATIFVSAAGTSAFLPVISEMKRPRDYPKAVYLCMGIVTASYLTFSLVVYRWCGQWVASPSLGSAGPTIKKVSYGVALLGLFVRLLRHSSHLQSNSLVHWSVWLGCTGGLCAVAFVIASGIPIFNYLIALAGSLCFAPLAIVLPACLWIYDHQPYRQASTAKAALYYGHCLMALVGLFMTVGGTYGVVQQIIDAYANGEISEAFSCADNSSSS